MYSPVTSMVPPAVPFRVPATEACSRRQPSGSARRTLMKVVGEAIPQSNSFAKLGHNLQLAEDSRCDVKIPRPNGSGSGGRLASQHELSEALVRPATRFLLPA